MCGFGGNVAGAISVTLQVTEIRVSMSVRPRV